MPHKNDKEVYYIMPLEATFDKRQVGKTFELKNRVEVYKEPKMDEDSLIFAIDKNNLPCLREKGDSPFLPAGLKLRLRNFEDASTLNNKIYRFAVDPVPSYEQSSVDDLAKYTGNIFKSFDLPDVNVHPSSKEDDEVTTYFPTDKTYKYYGIIRHPLTGNWVYAKKHEINPMVNFMSLPDPQGSGKMKRIIGAHDNAHLAGEEYVDIPDDLSKIIEEDNPTNAFFGLVSVEPSPHPVYWAMAKDPNQSEDKKVSPEVIKKIADRFFQQPTLVELFKEAYTQSIINHIANDQTKIIYGDKAIKPINIFKNTTDDENTFKNKLNFLSKHVSDILDNLASSWELIDPSKNTSQLYDEFMKNNNLKKDLENDIKNILWQATLKKRASINEKDTVRGLLGANKSDIHSRFGVHWRQVKGYKSEEVNKYIENLFMRKALEKLPFSMENFLSGRQDAPLQTKPFLDHLLDFLQDNRVHDFHEEKYQNAYNNFATARQNLLDTAKAGADTAPAVSSYVNALQNLDFTSRRHDALVATLLMILRGFRPHTNIDEQSPLESAIRGATTLSPSNIVFGDTPSFKIRYKQKGNKMALAEPLRNKFLYDFLTKRIQRVLQENGENKKFLQELRSLPPGAVEHVIKTVHNGDAQKIIIPQKKGEEVTVYNNPQQATLFNLLKGDDLHSIKGDWPQKESLPHDNDPRTNMATLFQMLSPETQKSFSKEHSSDNFTTYVWRKLFANINATYHARRVALNIMRSLANHMGQRNLTNDEMMNILANPHGYMMEHSPLRTTYHRNMLLAQRMAAAVMQHSQGVDEKAYLQPGIVEANIHSGLQDLYNWIKLKQQYGNNNIVLPDANSWDEYIKGDRQLHDL